MINALLILILVSAEGAQLVAVEPFADMVLCVAEQDRLAPKAKAKIPPGQWYALSCVPLEPSGSKS